MNTYMKCYNLPLLLRKFFFNIANHRDYIINHCNRPLKIFDKHCREWYLSHNGGDDEIRMPDDNLNG